MGDAMRARDTMGFPFMRWILCGLIAAAACGSSGTTGAGTPGEIPIVAAAGADVPYQLGHNPYGITGGAFFAKANQGSETVVLDTSQVGKVCLGGTVGMVPTPADGSHPPYSDYWGIELGFNLNQGTDMAKTPWTVPSNVSGFWFTVEGAAIPSIRFKTTPTGKDPAQEQDSCAIVNPISGEPTQVPFTEMYVQCWDGPQGTGVTDVSQGLVDMGLQVAASTDAEYPVDFCVTHVGVIAN
jgi:hypothetical protein